MKSKLLIMLFSMFVFFMHHAEAQERTISGKVTSDEDGSALPGVNVILKGTTVGTVTDIDGNYKVNVPDEDGILVFSFIGLASQEVPIGNRSVIDVTMSSDIKQLGEVVVTAQGIEREKKALGYAVSTVESKDLEQKTEGDIGRLLKGKAPGVAVTQTSGVSGSATNIIIRGYTSISGSNQPLFVVDGIPFDGGNNSNTGFVDGQTESSRFLDLDPNNVESVSVLKGLAATVLYGEKGRNGVILITTKNGSAKDAKEKMEISVSNSYFANEIASLPDYQDNYGGGFFQNFGFFFSNWGPNFNTRGERGISADGTVDHPYSRFQDEDLLEAFPEFQGARYDYIPYDNVEAFFRTGNVWNTSVNIRGAAEKVNYNVSYGYLNDIGFTPGNSLQRNNFGFGGNADLSNNFTIGATFNYTNTDYETPPIAASLGSGTIGDGGSVFGDVFYTPRSVDLMGLPFESPLTGGSVYYRSGNDIQNPRWTVKNVRAAQDVDRFFGNVFLRYNVNDWLSGMYRVGLDTYTEFNSFGQNKGGVDGPVNGLYRTIDVRNTIWDHTFNITANKELNEDFNLIATLGANGRLDQRVEQGVESQNQVVFGVLKHFNFIDHATVYSATSPLLDTEFESAESRLGVYASIALDFKRFLYLTLQGRNDWVSTLESENNRLFYPGVSLAFDATSAISGLQNSNVISYLKVRAGFGSSAGFPPAFSTRNTLGLNSRALVDRDGNVVTTNTVSDRLGNPDLKPERVDEIELGIESRLFNNRVGLNVSVYKKTTEDLILDRDLDPSTGFDVTRINAGELEVKGIEIDWDATVLELGAFKWNLNGNFVSDESEVIDLPEGIDQIQFLENGGISDLGNFAIEGETFGVIQGTTIVRDDNGNPIIDSQGFFTESNEISIIGDPNPDFTGALTNTFSYKGITFSFEWQYRQGGDIYSLTASTLVGRGITEDTDFDRTRTFILPGVDQEGNPNTKQIAATNLYFDVLGFGANELRVFDGTTIRLNEVSLSYSLPKSLLSKTPLGSVTFTASGFNLWFDAVNFPDHVNFDTNSLGSGVGNGVGMDFLSGPSSRRFGGSLKFTF